MPCTSSDQWPFQTAACTTRQGKQSELYTFVRLHQLTEQQTLTCFGEHYREVLAEPQGTSHMTIRIFMRQGWSGLSFDGMSLKERTKFADSEDEQT